MQVTFNTLFNFVMLSSGSLFSFISRFNSIRRQQHLMCAVQMPLNHLLKVTKCTNSTLIDTITHNLRFWIILFASAAVYKLLRWPNNIEHN